MTLHSAATGRCHLFEWSYEADDSEFPSRFLFDVSYQILDGEEVLRRIEPKSVVATDVRGNQLYSHDFSQAERKSIALWFNARLRSLGATLTQAISTAMERDRHSRSDATEETFLELSQDRICSDLYGFQEE